MYVVVMPILAALTLVISIGSAAACDGRPAKADEAIAPCSDVIEGSASTIASALGAEGTLAGTELLTLESWTACPTIEQTTEMLMFDGYSHLCEVMNAGARVIVTQAQRAPATRWLCIDEPLGHGTVTSCQWETFRDEPKMWLCVRSAGDAAPCRWGPVEYFISETGLTATARPQ